MISKQTVKPNWQRVTWLLEDLARTLVKDRGYHGVWYSVEAGKWLTPAHPDVDMWLSEARAFDPSAHTGDRLMASWLAKEGVRMYYEALPKQRIRTVSVHYKS